MTSAEDQDDTANSAANLDEWLRAGPNFSGDIHGDIVGRDKYVHSDQSPDASSVVRVRVTLNLTEQTSEALGWLAEHTGDTRTGVINRAIQLYRFLEEQREGGGEILVRRPDGTIQIIVIH